MPRKAPFSAAAAVSDEQLPTCTGAQIELAQWMVDLHNASHLLEADLAYFISTLSAITSCGQTAVLNIPHSILLQRKALRGARTG